MSEICTCVDPIVDPNKKGDQYCDRCGEWWALKHGSNSLKKHKGALPLPHSLKGNRFIPIYRTKSRGYSRNSKCPCGSGKRFKRCCEPKVKK